MNKKKKAVALPRKKKKVNKSITTTSVAFKEENLNFIKNHDLHKKGDLSVSWIINKLIEKFRDGSVTLDLE